MPRCSIRRPPSAKLSERVRRLTPVRPSTASRAASRSPERTQAAASSRTGSPERAPKVAPSTAFRPSSAPCRGRPQRPQVAASSDPAALVVGIRRLADRGEQSSQLVLQRCLAFLSDLQVNAPGGVNSVWMIAPVLQEAKEHLLQANDVRQELDAEVGTLRERAEQLLKDVQAKHEELRRAEEVAAERVRRQLAAKREIEEAAALLRLEISKVNREIVTLNYESTEGLARDRAEWAEERQQLQEQTETLEKDIAEKSIRVNQQLPDLQQEQRDAILVESMRVRKFGPDAKTKAELTKRRIAREGKCEDLEQQLQDLEVKRSAKKGRIGVTKGSRKDRPDSANLTSSKLLDQAKKVFSQESSLNENKKGIRSVASLKEALAHKTEMPSGPGT